MTDALIMSGGGANGAYEVGGAGVLLTDYGVKPGILAGTSVGSLNAAMLAHYPMGDEVKAAQALFDVWHRLAGNEDVYTNNPDLVLSLGADLFGDPPPGRLHAVYDTTPLWHLVRNVMHTTAVRASGRKLATAAMSLSTREIVYWSESDPDLVEGVMASSAFPIMFPPVKARGDTFVDGGVREVVPIQRAIELGATRLFVIVTEPATVDPVEKAEWGIVDQALRCLSASIDEVLRGDIARGWELARARGIPMYLIQPSTPLGDSFDFSRKKNHELIVRGDDDTRAVMAAAGLVPVR